MKLPRLLCLLLLLPAGVQAAAKAPVYIWVEAERFEGVEGRFDYWRGPSTYKATGSWGISGPGISAEWSQGGESEWNSIGAAPQENNAACHRDIVIPRAGRYKVWVRYVDHRGKTEPFRVTLQQSGKNVLSAEMGVQAVVPPNDEYELYWGFSFGWGETEGDLGAGPTRILLMIEKPGEGWRQVDAVLVTDDPHYTPVAREKPQFGYVKTMAMGPTDGALWRGSANRISTGAAWKESRPHDYRNKEPKPEISVHESISEQDQGRNATEVAARLPEVLFLSSTARQEDLEIQSVKHLADTEADGYQDQPVGRGGGVGAGNQNRDQPGMLSGSKDAEPLEQVAEELPIQETPNHCPSDHRFHNVQHLLQGFW